MTTPRADLLTSRSEADRERRRDNLLTSKNYTRSRLIEMILNAEDACSERADAASRYYELREKYDHIKEKYVRLRAERDAAFMLIGRRDAKRLLKKKKGVGGRRASPERDA